MGTKVTPREGDETPAPPPTRAMHGYTGAPPPFLQEAHLNLVFELRGQMADQEHRVLLMGHRLDMLFDVYSNAPANKKCPTCAQPFVMQAREAWHENEDDRPPGI
jgi:hypothetical protein